jgi:hypothetical protein
MVLRKDHNQSNRCCREPLAQKVGITLDVGRRCATHRGYRKYSSLLLCQFFRAPICCQLGMLSPERRCRASFHVVRGEARIRDPDGINISESDMASLRGAKIGSEMRETFPELFQGWEDWSVEVVDELGTVVQTFTLQESSKTPTSGSDEGSQQDGQRSGRLH